eukprot:PhF_6_TR39654/c0_g1_i2/m.58836
MVTKWPSEWKPQPRPTAGHGRRSPTSSITIQLLCLQKHCWQLALSSTEPFRFVASMRVSGITALWGLSWRVGKVPAFTPQILPMPASTLRNTVSLSLSLWTPSKR